ncbi:polysaccharide deacetylase family protein [Anoxybacillus rupiensis]|jgi:peptidoglycan/xylan/chitin deacetylase (PgdA/CDA1 family)|uniref:Polysaccharide deacetylase family protein n=1 Tax=Anoxybacteroides rupiense TaxID=311460 RepID=A0ABT5W2D2_9BACL|nr:MULTISPECIES: polysaccharide deacetylase family protein [Anoxybacillus]MBS2772144.1 polysaccharide deacetylase family protein [Anoxybacillus rupiensis]MDE8563467.1 polysaccharide deacetylase family protein [Anoxybacillus rupiensis]QHC02890.1 polysaccharide deacetylase family protein [Anoxybacillus sp. PDR2]
MRRIFLFIFSCLAVFLVLFTHKATADGQKMYIKAIQSRVPLLDNSTGSLLEVGYMEKGDILKIYADAGKNWWKIKFGNSYAYVYKGAVHPFCSQTVSGENAKNLKNSNRTILINKNERVYDNSKGKLIPFVTIKGNMRYPIIKKINHWYQLDVGGRIGYLHDSKAKWDNGVPVLMYHHILKPAENKNYRNVSTTISDLQFNQQMNWLKTHGYEAITLERLENYVKGTANLPAKAVVITFDDGLKTSFLYAYPVLKSYGFKAANFVITSRMTKTPQPFNPDKLQFLSQTEMNSMKDVFTFESHTHQLHHLNGNKSDVITKPYATVKADIKQSISILEGSKYFAYPFGQYNANTIKLLKELNIHMAVTTKPGKVQVGDALLEIKRLGVEPNCTLNQFAKMVEN